MSEKRMVYAEDVIQRIRDLAPEILGGWYNPDMENEVEQLVCVVENTQTAAAADAKRWRKTAEEPPTEADANDCGDVLSINNNPCDNFITNWPWNMVAAFPDCLPVWMPLPKKPYLGKGR